MRNTHLVALLLVVTLLAGATGAYAQDILTILKTVGIAAAVHIFAPQLNSFINSLLLTNNAETRAATKVVPILSISIGISTPGQATIGAAQVAGPKSAVDRVQAVAALDGNFQNVVHVRAFVPVDSLQPWKALRRVIGVGVSAIIDLKI